MLDLAFSPSLALQVDQWLDISQTLVPGSGFEAACAAVDAFLSLRTFLVGHAPSLADVACWAQLQLTLQWDRLKKGGGVAHLARWWVLARPRRPRGCVHACAARRALYLLAVSLGMRAACSPGRRRLLQPAASPRCIRWPSKPPAALAALSVQAFDARSCLVLLTPNPTHPLHHHHHTHTTTHSTHQTPTLHPMPQVRLPKLPAGAGSGGRGVRPQAAQRAGQARLGGGCRACQG